MNFIPTLLDTHHIWLIPHLLVTLTLAYMIFLVLMPVIINDKNFLGTLLCIMPPQTWRMVGNASHSVWIPSPHGYSYDTAYPDYLGSLSHLQFDIRLPWLYQIFRWHYTLPHRYFQPHGILMILPPSEGNNFSLSYKLWHQRASLRWVFLRIH